MERSSHRGQRVWTLQGRTADGGYLWKPLRGKYNGIPCDECRIVPDEIYVVPNAETFRKTNLCPDHRPKEEE